MKRGIGIWWAGSSAMALALVLLSTCRAGSRDDDLPESRGRPRSQISYKGTSPFFKVDFDRYVGVVSCEWCHPKATAVWKESEAFHLRAFDLLGEDDRNRVECLPCHVTAFNDEGIYPLENENKRTQREAGYTWNGDHDVNRYFEGVQCEACHGPNCGNKYSREQLTSICRKCHPKPGSQHGFDVEQALARMTHAHVGADERVDYDTYAGQDACFMCHWTNYQAWTRDQQPHARAYDVLDAAGRENPDCLRCHTTGFNQEGLYPLEEEGQRSSRRSGFTFGGDPDLNERFHGVQCEACHGINCGTYTGRERIRRQCENCHSGECENDRGFHWETHYEKVRHKPPEGYSVSAAGEGSKVIIDWYDWSRGIQTAEAYRMPLLVVLSNPPDG